MRIIRELHAIRPRNLPTLRKINKAMILTDHEDTRRYSSPPDERDGDQDPWEGAMDEAHAWQEQKMIEDETAHHND